MLAQDWNNKILDHQQTDIILVVDDNPNNLDVLSDTLSQAGFDVAIAVDGESALKQLQFAPVSLILLDVMMPGINGFETCQRLKSNVKTKDIPVIFMTALSETENKVHGFELGAVDYITKPFQQAEVLARINTHLKVKYLTQTLAERNAELEDLARNLENRVIAQTAELSQSLQQLQQAQLQLVQSEKMSALGNLIAGVAHEINNPVGFLNGNIKPALDYVQDLFGLIDLYQTEYAEPTSAIAQEIEEIDLDYLREDLPKLLNSMRVGVDRIRSISDSLRTFSRSDKDYKTPFNIHDGIDSTVLILQHRLKANEHRPEIQVIKQYGNLPKIECFPGQLNQVFMNILANAIDALEDSNHGKSFADIQATPNVIEIETAFNHAQQTAMITIKDNGIGMSDDVQQRIFDHLFTTKDVGNGTGLGLAIAHQIVTQEHGGTITVTSQLKQGTEFVITLPQCAHDGNR